MKRLISALLAVLLALGAVSAAAEATPSPTPKKETVLEPLWPVPDYVTWLLDVARGELGYREGPHGYSKYGEWAGDPYAQWCAEFLCWCVDQVDQAHGTQLLREVYPLYSGQNTGRNWFIQQGRYIVRNGHLENWGYQWLKGEDAFLTTGDYIPQPGDWVFFTWTSTTDTDHVAMVEYCAVDPEGNVIVHCIEGNTPVEVKRAAYPLTYTRILGYGTVHDVADWTMRSGNSGEKVRQLQERLIYLDLMPEGSADGVYGSAVAEVIRAYQARKGLKVSGIANIDTQRALQEDYEIKYRDDPAAWSVVDDTGDEPISLDGWFN